MRRAESTFHSMRWIWSWNFICPTQKIQKHSRWHQIWHPHKYICNAFVMLKYGNLFVMAANPFGNLNFVITFVHNTKVKHKLRICQEYKSEALADNKDLHVMQIPNLAEQFLVDTYLLSNSKYVYELTNWFTYSNITNILRIHLRGLQIWRCLPCSSHLKKLGVSDFSSGTLAI